MDKKLDILWSGDDFKERNYYLPSDPHIIRMTYGEESYYKNMLRSHKKGF